MPRNRHNPKQTKLTDFTGDIVPETKTLYEWCMEIMPPPNPEVDPTTPEAYEEFKKTFFVDVQIHDCILHQYYDSTTDKRLMRRCEEVWGDYATYEFVIGSDITETIVKEGHPLYNVLLDLVVVAQDDDVLGDIDEILSTPIDI